MSKRTLESICEDFKKNMPNNAIQQKYVWRGFRGLRENLTEDYLINKISKS
jgi:hypothetical protein